MNEELIERLHVGANELYDKRADHIRPYATLMREAADALSHQSSAQVPEPPDDIGGLMSKSIPGFKKIAHKNATHTINVSGQKVPDGWKLVPIEASSDMLEALAPRYSREPLCVAWERAVQAAPEPPHDD